MLSFLLSGGERDACAERVMIAHMVYVLDAKKGITAFGQNIDPKERQVYRSTLY